MKQGPS